MLARTEPARAAVYAAAVTGDPVEITAAKPLAGEAAVRNARGCPPDPRRDGLHLGGRCSPPPGTGLVPLRGPGHRGPRGGAPGRRPGGRPAVSGQGGRRPAEEARERGRRRVTQRSRAMPMPTCALCVIRHRVESVSGSGTLRGMRVVLEPGDPGAACAAAPVRGEGSRRRCAGPARRAFLAVPARSCSTPRNVRRTVCTTHTPSRWNMPEALVAVTVRQPCCRVGESRSVTLRRREAMCPPVRMV